MKKGVLFLVLGVAVILGVFFVTEQNLNGNNEETNATEQQNKSKETAKDSTHNALKEDEAIKIASNWHETNLHVMAGGDYKDGEYQSFEHEGMHYRYFAGNLSTKQKLLDELTNSVTHEIAEQYIEHYGYIEHDGKMAQPEADGGSIADWNKATAKLISEGNKPVFEFTVPLGDTGTTEKYDIEFEYVKNAGWRISKLPTLIQ